MVDCVLNPIAFNGPLAASPARRIDFVIKPAQDRKRKPPCFRDRPVTWPGLWGAAHAHTIGNPHPDQSPNHIFHRQNMSASHSVSWRAEVPRRETPKACVSSYKHHGDDFSSFVSVVSCCINLQLLYYCDGRSGTRGKDFTPGTGSFLHLINRYPFTPTCAVHIARA